MAHKLISNFIAQLFLDNIDSEKHLLTDGAATDNTSTIFRNWENTGLPVKYLHLILSRFLEFLVYYEIIYQLAES